VRAYCSNMITVPEMTYNVFSGTLNPTHFTSSNMIASCPCECQRFHTVALY